MALSWWPCLLAEARTTFIIPEPPDGIGSWVKDGVVHPQEVSASAAAPFVMAQGSTIVTNAEPAADWWRLFDDPVLNGLVQDALAANTDIRVAEARLQRARAALHDAGVV